MTITPKCETPGCVRASVHVVTTRFLLLFKRIKRLCPGCEEIHHEEKT